jgi:hypothetical protein
MRIHLLSLLLAGVAATTNAQEEAASAEQKAPPAGPVQVGPALGSTIDSVLIPPTKPAVPYVTTGKGLFVLDAEAGTWKDIYTSTASSGDLFMVRGYDKNSSVLYLAHETGIAVSKDAGTAWIEAAPAGFSGKALVALEVNPTERKEAVACAASEAWITRNYGKSWEAFPLPSSAERIVGAGFSPASPPILVVATDKAVYTSDETNSRWTALMRSTEGPVALAIPEQHPFSVTLDAKEIVTVFDLIRPGYRFTSELSLSGTPSALAADCDGRGILWFASGKQILCVDLQSAGAKPASIHTASEKIANLTAHPRKPDTIFWTVGPRLFQMAAATGDRDVPAVVLPQQRFEKGGALEEIKVAAAGMDEAEQRAQRILGDVMAKQPPLEEAVAAALKYANYRPKETEQWKQNVRRKNLVPQLRLYAGQTERQMDRYDEIRTIDRFGVPGHEDHRINDDTEYMDSFGVELRWNLSGLVFDSDQLAVSEEARKRAEQRNALITQVTELYYRRLELLVQQQLNSEKKAVADIVTSQLRFEQISGTLNGICGSPLFDTQLP